MSNTKKIQSTPVQSVSEHQSNGSSSNFEEWKTFDIRKATQQDIQAAVSLLCLILDNPAILDLVVGEIEKIRTRLVEQESLPKREDFHPELKPVG